MRAAYAFLALPLAATMFNLLLALAFLKHTRTKAQEIPALQESVKVFNLCAADADGNEQCGASYSLFDRALTAVKEAHSVPEADDDEQDPNLRHMPGYDFMAYVPPDIATFYGDEPGSRTELTPKFTGQAGKFTNMSPERLSLYWHSGDKSDPGRFIANCGPWESCGTATFPGHVFFFAKPNQPKEEICRFRVVKGTSVYYYDPFSEGDESARCVTTAAPRFLEELSPKDLAMYESHQTNNEFANAYRSFTGEEWLTMYPRNSPRHKMWRADFIGQQHKVSTRETHFITHPLESDLPKMGMQDMRRNDTNDVPLRQYRTPDSLLNFTLKTISCSPRAFEISNFLSDVEVDHILELATGKKLHLSTTGSNGVAKSDSDTRTSKNTWVGRYSSPITDAIYRRVADVLRMDEALLRHRFADEHPELGTENPISEDMQLVHYDVGEQYTAHHDFGYPDNTTPDSPSRSINVLMYLNEGMVGGETSFPRPRSAESAGSFDIKPEKGKAVIFYMVNPDGNLDDHTQHAALPIKEGEKWLSNLWIWDPVKP